MAATIKIYNRFEVTIDGDDVEGGSIQTASEISIVGEKVDITKTIGAGNSSAIWQAGVSPGPSNFDFLWLEADGTVLVEIACDYGNDNGDEFLHINVNASAPLILAADDSIAARTAAFTGTADVIDQIKVKNEHASESRIVRLFVAS